MKRNTLSIAASLALAGTFSAQGARAADVVIGDIDDLSGVYADVIG